DRKKFAKKFDLILDIKDLPNWPKLEKLKTQNAKRKTISRFKNYLVIKPKRSNNFSAFVPISNGCNNFCSYCVVPYVRGPLVCRDYKEILREIKDAIEKGSKEIWLLGQNVNRYRSKSKTINFAKLLKMINDIPGNFWLRFTSPHPSDFSNELIETMAKCEKVTPYLNLPVQSGDNKVLKRMSRPYTVEQYKNLVKKIREKIPGICLSTDVIVGFPGETKKQFENTVKLFKQIKFDMAYIAKYSPRNGTMAAKMKDNVSHQEKEKRYNLLTESLKRTALEKNKKYIGKIIKVLATEKKNDFLIGKSFHYKTVKFKGLKNLIGRFVKVKIIEADFFDLKGKLSQPTVC
ncbi:tRNA (N6-isopentenyl adenosine(37)-C2)-methylthiotransferase MiaB, partial [bacterium (Candidatus Gribaldobacteria) CG_4_9_14_3_um_filter_33_9]